MTRSLGRYALYRAEVFGLFLWVTVTGYLVWHFASVLLGPPAYGGRYWGLCAVVVVGVLVTRSLQGHSTQLAAGAYLASAMLSTTLALWLFESPFASILYPVLALAAVILLDPVAGLVVALGSGSLLWSLSGTPAFAFLSPDLAFQVGCAAVLVVACAWVLERNMIVAVDWWLHSYEQALRNADEARNHRAQLVTALKQLDIAYYRLERANASLELAWKAAEAAEHSKSEFVTNISHELRTPLNLIVGFSEMIVTSPESYGVSLPAAYRGDLNEIYRSAQHLLKLADDVIDLARVGSGRMALAREPLDLEQVIQDACDIIRGYVAAKGLFLRIDIRPGLPILEIDRLRIRQVLLNLLTNAARFTTRGGITVGASAATGLVQVSVSDTGQGILPDDLPKVFDEFYHVDGDAPWNRQLAGFGGAGLGLPISKRLVELHGGQMGVESTSGTGTSFWFTLPGVSRPGRRTRNATRQCHPTGSLPTRRAGIGARRRRRSVVRVPPAPSPRIPSPNSPGSSSRRPRWPSSTAQPRSSSIRLSPAAPKSRPRRCRSSACRYLTRQGSPPSSASSPTSPSRSLDSSS